MAEEARAGEERDGEGARRRSPARRTRRATSRSTCPTSSTSSSTPATRATPHGATIGQSLPNWGPVANEGRGRTVAMTNLYTDDDSEAARIEQVDVALLQGRRCASRRLDPKLADDDRTVLHEAAHNLGPAHEYKVERQDRRRRSSAARSRRRSRSSRRRPRALYFADWLVDKKAASTQRRGRRSAHVRDVTWAFGHISQGMYDGRQQAQGVQPARGDPDRLAVKDGALDVEAPKRWRRTARTRAASMSTGQVEPAIASLAKTVLHIKGAGDKAGAWR